MTITSHERFKSLLSRAGIDDDIIGLFLGGSRGKGFENEHSDYDVGMVVKDDAAEAYKKEFDVDEAGIDLEVFSLSEFEAYANWKGPHHWDRYDFAYVPALIDSGR